MKKYDKRLMSQVLVADGKKLITIRSIEEEMNDQYYRLFSQSSEVRNDLRHFGRCQRVNIVDYNGDDYTQDHGDQPAIHSTPTPMPQIAQIITDLKHAPKISLVDMSNFDRKPGSIIRIVPKPYVRFVKVTVRIADLYNRELVHAQAWDEYDRQEWIFIYFPQHKFSPDPGNLQITICASEKPREKSEGLVDVYELPAEKMRERAMSLN